MPITLISYVGMPAEKSNAVAGMINFMRNIGSSVGTSMVTTLLARREQFHQTTLVGHTRVGNQAFQNAIAGLAQRLVHSGISPPDALVRAYAATYRALQAQAATLAFVDTFWVLSVGATIMFVLSFLLRKNDPRAAGEAAAG